MDKLTNEIKIIKWIILLPIIGVILTSFILTNIFISSKYESHDAEISKLQELHISNLKKNIKEKIENLSLVLGNNYNNEIHRSKQALKDIVSLGHKTLTNIHRNNAHLPEDELYHLINQRMSKLRFFEKENVYFFIYRKKDAKAIIFPSAPHLVGTSLITLKDEKGKDLYNSFNKTLSNQKKEGFERWYLNRANSNLAEEKIGFIKLYEPLDLVIGTALYTNDIQERIVKNSISFMKEMKSSDNGYIFIMDTKGTSLLHKNQKIIGLPLKELDTNIQKNVNIILEAVFKEQSSFVEYKQPKILFKGLLPAKKISYIKHIPYLDWIIGTGLYTDNLNTQIKQKEELLEKNLQKDISAIIFASLLVTLIIIVLLLFLSKKIQNIFQYYSKNLEDSNKKLHILNEKLEQKVNKQVSILRQKDALLNQQSKLAAMGEMLGNIAHQWRQPLSAISSLASGIRVKKEFAAISEEELDKNLESIVTSTKILSRTIDDFRNYYSKDKEVKKFKIENTINNVLSLISANLQNKEIELNFDINDIDIYSYENELIQVLLNILNNAKDALINISNPKYVFISAKEHKEHVFIEIYDNAGGIDKDIMSRIFEPYFTTKFKSQGTGIGLYMTKNIIDSNLKGQIEVENKSFKYLNQEFKGALFRIKLPLKI